MSQHPFGTVPTLVSYEVVTAVGAAIHTFADRKKAMAYASDPAVAARFPGLRVERVTRTETRVNLSLARLQMVGSAQ